MSGFNDRFGGSTIQAAQVAYANLTIGADFTLLWPPYATVAGTAAARIMDVTASVGSLTLTLPDAREVSVGQDMFIVNRGANTFTVDDASGAAITTMVAGQIRYLYLTDNSTAAGVWQSVLFGAVTSSIDASSLAGAGLTVLSAALAQNTTVTVFSGSTAITNAERARAYVWTGGTGTLTLPLTSAASGFFVEVRNQGTGVLTIAPSGGELIDTSANITLNVNESCFVHAGNGAWYTVGRGRNASFNFTQLTKTVTGGTSTLSLTEAANVVQKYTGTLLSNQTVVVPAVVQVYYVSNQTAGSFSFTVQSPTPGTTVSIPTGQNAVLFCDGTNVINCSTTVAGISSILFAAGSVSSPSIGISTSNTGFYSSGANEVAITSNGVQVAKFDGSGLLQAPLAGATAVRATSANSTADFFADRPAGQIASVTYRTAGVARWRVAANGTAESGANAGSDFSITGYSDAGASLGNYLTIARATGNATFTGSVTASSFSGTVSSAAQASNLAGGLAGQIPYQSAPNTTAMLTAGALGQILTGNGAAAPAWLAAGTAGQLLQANGVGVAPSYVTALSNGITATTQSAGDNSTKVATTAYVDQATSVLRGYIDGLTLSTAGSSTTFTVAAGQAADDANAVMVSLTSAISKTTGSWVVGSGNGGLDTGSIANLTWYHAWLIRRPDTGVEDVLVSLSATSPTMPANYTQKRRIGAMRTNGSGQWTAFRQIQDWFEWDASVSDAAVSNPGTAAVTRTLTVPTGVAVQAVFNGGTRNLASAVAGNVYFSPLSKSDEAANEVAAPFWSAGAYTQSAAAGARSSYTMNQVWTNTSAQIRTRLSASDGNVSLYIATLGWIDPRGKNA